MSKKIYGNFLTEPTSANLLVTKYYETKWKFLKYHIWEKKSRKMNRKYRTGKKGESLNTFSD